MPKMRNEGSDYLARAEWIEWTDAWSYSGWRSIHRVEEDPNVCRNHSVGFVVKETDESVMLAQSIDTTMDNCDGVMAIPKVNIVNRYTIG